MKRVMILLAVVFLFSTAHSLTLTEAIERAMDENLQLKMQELSLSTAKLDEVKAVTQFLPKLTGSGTFVRLDTVPTTTTMTVMGPVTIQVGLQDNYSYDIKLSQPVFIQGKLVLGYLISKEKYKMAENDLSKTKSDIKLAVTQLYLSALLTDEMVGVTSKVLDSKNEHLKTVQSRYGYGSASKIELLSSEIEVKNLEVQVLDLKKQRDNVYRTLNFMMGADITEEITLEDSLSGYIAEIFDTLNIDMMTSAELLKISLERKKEIKGAEFSKNMVKKIHTMNQMAFLPTVALFSQYTYKNYYTYYNDSTFYDGSINFGVTASMDIFAGGGKVIDVLKSGKQVKQSEMALSMLKEKTKLDIEYLLNGYENSKQTIEMYAKTVLLSEEAYKTAQEQYNRGIISNNDYLDAETNYLRSQSGYLKAIYDKIINQVSILNSIGVL
ncbi:MAG: TolC family protein [bacterium]